MAKIKRNQIVGEEDQPTHITLAECRRKRQSRSCLFGRRAGKIPSANISLRPITDAAADPVNGSMES